MSENGNRKLTGNAGIITDRVRRSEESRIRSVHLSIVIIMTLTLCGMLMTGALLGWELWVLVLPATGTFLSWVFHIGRRMGERQRLWFYMIVVWMIIIYHGVHATSFYDLACITAIEFAMLALTNERRLLDVGLLVFWFCYLWSGFQVVTAEDFALTSLVFARIILHLCVVLTTYLVAGIIIRNRSLIKEDDSLVIEELTQTRHHTEEFLVNVSHAFRTPVNVVTGISRVMEEREAGEQTRQDAAHLLNAGREMTGRLDDLLDYTELETGRFSVSAEPYMIGSVINDVLAGLQLYTKETAAQVIVDVDAAIPPLLRGDQRRVKKVLHHLMDNALKYTPHGGVYVRVYRVEEAYGINLCIEVQDSGIGMDAQTLSRLREGLYHAAAEKRQISEGFGLGLEIVYGIVHAMNGFVRIDSEPGKGTRVHVSFPQEVAEEGRCMEMRNKDRMKLAFYQQPGKFDVPVVREYYTQMIMHVIQAFRLKLDRTMSLADLKALLKKDTYTHLFIADEEYAEEPAWFDLLAETIHVIVVARLSFAPSPHSRVTVLRKPLYAFPLVEALNAETEEDAKEALREEERPRFAGTRALVVDDEEMNLVVTRGILATYGIEADLADSGQAALDMARHTDYQIIFMDHMMPGMDGVECAHRIRDVLVSEGRGTAIVALTANAVSGAREMFIREGFDGFVAKPVEETEMTRVLKHVLGKKPETQTDTEQ